MFRSNYDKPGKGVNKRNPNQPRINIFFEVLLGKLWPLCKLNLFYVVSSIPTFLVSMIVMGLFSSPITDAIMLVTDEFEMTREFMLEILKIDIALRYIFSFVIMIFIGQGPTTVGITYILKSYANEEYVFFFSDWWEYTKSNFRQASVIWIIDLIVVSLLAIAVRYYSGSVGVLSIFTGIVLLVVLIYLLMHFYIYQLILTFKSNIKDIYKNSFILAMQNVVPNLIIFAVLLLIHIGLPYFGIRFNWGIAFWIVFILAEFLILPTLSGFIVNFHIYPQLEKHIKEENIE